MHLSIRIENSHLSGEKETWGGGDGDLFQLASLTLVDIEVSTLLKWSFSGLSICFLQTAILYTYSTESTQHVQLYIGACKTKQSWNLGSK